MLQVLPLKEILLFAKSFFSLCHCLKFKSNKYFKNTNENMCINKYIFWYFCMFIYEYLNLFVFFLYLLTVNI